MRTLLVATLGVALILGCSPPGTNTTTTKKTAGETEKPAVDPKKPIFETYAEGLAYIANSGEDTLSTYDLKTLDAVPGTIKTGHEPGNIARDPKNLLYFPARYMDSDAISKSTPEGGIEDSFRSGSLWAINPMLGNSIQQKGIIGDADDKPDAVFVAVSNDGVWVAIADQSVNKIVIKHQTDDERKRSLEFVTGPGPAAMAFSPDGKFLAVVCNDPAGTTDPDNVHIYDFLGNDSGPVEIAKIPVGDRPSQVAAAPDNVTFYVTVTGSQKVVAVNAKTKGAAGEWTVEGAPRGILSDPTGANYYVTLEDTNRVIRLDPATGATTNSVEVGKEPWMMAIDTHNGRLWVTNHGDDSVSVISLGDFSLEKTIPTGKLPTGVAIVLNPTGAPVPAPETPVVETAGAVSTEAAPAPIENSAVQVDSGATDASGDVADDAH